MTDHKIDEPKLPERETPNYTNWDYPTWIKNNPNATPEQIRQFFREKKLHDFMIFGKW
jgi:hypothetical protein